MACVTAATCVPIRVDAVKLFTQKKKVPTLGKNKTEQSYREQDSADQRNPDQTNAGQNNDHHSDVDPSYGGQRNAEQSNADQVSADQTKAGPSDDQHSDAEQTTEPYD